MILAIQVEDSYQIRSPYDPDLIQLIKNVPGRTWFPELKAWVIPADKIGFFITQLKGTVYETQLQVQSNENINVNAALNGETQIPDIDVLSDYTYRVQEGLHPYKHQIDSLKFAVWRYQHNQTSGFLLADEPGAAKTLQITNIAIWMREHYNMQHCLIIACVNSAKYNWKEDIEKHSNGTEDPYLLGSRIRRNGTINLDGGGAEKLEDLECMTKYGPKGTEPLPFFLILNIEAIRTKRKKYYPLADKLIELLNNGTIGMVALDEIHRNCSMQSQQGKQLLRIKKATHSNVQWYPMTGTPITSKPTDVFLPLRLIDGHNSDSYWYWCQKFCVYGGFGGHEIVGYKNIDVLKGMLQPNMLRRLKKDILDLPPKIQFTEYITNSPYQNSLYTRYQADLISEKEEIKRALNPMAKFLRLRQINGSPELVDQSLQVDKNYLSKNAKMQRCLEIIDDIVANGEKVIVFSNWVEPLRTLYHFAKQRYKVCCYTGTMSSEDRQKHKRVFINNPKYQVMIGTVGALGTSHTLTVARNIIFYDVPWNPADIEQCEDRCHRSGTTQSVNIYKLVTVGTIDEVVHQILSKKEGTAKYIVDNELDLRNHPEIVDLLLGGTR